MDRQINFDMDGTLADFYGVENWLAYILDSDATPYEVASPLLNLALLVRHLHRLQKLGYKINIISWLAKNSNSEYDSKVIQAKKKWLKKHLPSMVFDNIYIVAYGTPKHTIAKGILFDDEEQNRINWGEGAYGVENIIEILRGFK